MVVDRYMVIAFKSVCKGSVVIIENNLRGFSWQAEACIMIAADAVLWYQYAYRVIGKCSITF